MLLLSEKHCERGHIFFSGNHKQPVSFKQRRFGAGDAHLPVAPKARYDKFRLYKRCCLAYGFSEYSGVVNLECGYVCVSYVIVGISGGYVFWLHGKGSYNDYCEYNAYYSERIGYGTAKSCPACALSELLECLLRCTERGGVCGCAGNYAYHI